MDDIEKEIRTIEKDIAKIEGRLDQDDRSVTKRFSMWGGLIALFISILIGGFQIYEYTILRKEVAREANVIQLGTYIRRISELNGAMASSALLADTREKQARASAEGKIINGEKLVVVRLADRLLKEEPDAGGFASYITMTYEMLNQGNNDKALLYANAAFSKSVTTPEKVESMRYIGQVQFAPGEKQNISAARQTFEDALALSKSEKSFLGPQLMANTLSSVAIVEANFGECENAKESIKTLTLELSALKATRLLQTTLGEIRYGLIGANKCQNILSP